MVCLADDAHERSLLRELPPPESRSRQASTGSVRGFPAPPAWAYYPGDMDSDSWLKPSLSRFRYSLRSWHKFLFALSGVRVEGRGRDDPHASRAGSRR